MLLISWTDSTLEEATSGLSSLQQDSNVTGSKQQFNREESDAEMARRAQEEGCVSVVFPGTVTQGGCCRFVGEILKCVLYQRQQLPMTYDQLVYSQKKRQASMQVISRTHDMLTSRRMLPFEINSKCLFLRIKTS